MNYFHIQKSQKAWADVLPSGNPNKPMLAKLLKSAGKPVTEQNKNELMVAIRRIRKKVKLEWFDLLQIQRQTDYRNESIRRILNALVEDGKIRERMSNIEDGGAHRLLFQVVLP